MGKVEVTFNGKVYTAKYKINHGMVTVQTVLYGERSTQLGSLSAEWLARDLLHSLLTDAGDAGLLEI